MELDNIRYWLGVGGVQFEYDGGTAFLQIPDTPDSQHVINGLSEEKWTGRHNEIYDALVNYYYDSFVEYQHAVMSAEIGYRIHAVVETVFKGRKFFVAFDNDGDGHILVKSPYCRIYNKRHLYQKATLFDTDGNDRSIIKRAELELREEDLDGC